MPTLYRVEYTPPAPPLQAWTKSNVIAVVFVTDAQFAELGFDNDDVCSVEWQERPDLFVELWRQEEMAEKASLVPGITQKEMDEFLQIVRKEDKSRQAESPQKPPA